MAAKHQQVRQNYTPRAQKDCLKRSFLMENFFSKFGARSSGLESLLFGTLAKKLVLIIAFYKHRGTTWWREIFNKQSTNRFWSLRTLRKKLRISGKKLLHWHLCWNFILNARLISFKRKIPRKISFCFSTLERRI